MGWPKRTRRRVRLWANGFAARARGLTPIHVLHIYKTGGTALEHALDGVTHTRTHAIFSHKHSVGLGSIPRGQKVVFVVRDPVARFVSGFYDRQREGRPRYYTPWSDAERNTFERFPTPNAIGEALAGGGAGAEQAKAALASLDRMTTPWSAWLGTHEDFLSRRADVLFVGRQESLASDFERLRELLALPAEVKLPSSDVDAHRAQNIDRTLSDTAHAALADAFADDFAWIALLEREGFLPPDTLRNRPQEGPPGATGVRDVVRPSA